MLSRSDTSPDPAGAAVDRLDVVVAIGAAVVLMVIGFAVGFHAHASALVPEGVVGGAVLGVDGTFLVVLGTILAQNLGAALLAYTGVFTFGITTVASVFLTGAFVGATSEAVSSSIGVSTTMARVLPYVVLEVGGVLVAAGAGLLPLVGFVAGQLRGRPRPPFLATLACSLRLLAAGCGLIALGAAIEASLIVAHR